MKLAVYINTTGKSLKQKHLYDFAEGARKHNVEVIENKSNFYEKGSTHGVIFAFKNKGNKSLKSSENARIRLYESYPDKTVFFIDSDVLCHYNAPLNKSYLRYSYRSIYPNEADYFLQDLDYDKWKKFDLNMKDWKIQRGDKIVLLLNRGKRGFSAKGKNSFEWAFETIKEIRQYSDRHILIRPHNVNAKNFYDPVDDEYKTKIFNTFKNVTIKYWEDCSLDDVLKQAWATVSFTTTSAAVSLLEGIPIFVTSDSSYVYDFRSGDLSSIETPHFIDRDNFKHKYANSHWSDKEIKDGIFWGKIKKYL